MKKNPNNKKNPRKFRAEHDRASCYNELNNTRAAVDQVAREKVSCRPLWGMSTVDPWGLLCMICEPSTHYRIHNSFTLSP